MKKTNDYQQRFSLKNYVQRKQSKIYEDSFLRMTEKIKWSPELKTLWSLIKVNQFVLVSGKAGTGKSHLLSLLCDLLKNHSDITLSIAAPTAVAAMNVGGMTLHNWLGMGLANEDVGTLIRNLDRGKYKKTYSSVYGTDILLIDEVSMVDPLFFEKIAKLCGYVTVGNFKPFGNIKVVFFGDFLQIPPINKSNATYVFQTDIWSKMSVKRMVLRAVYRQKDKDFLKVLNYIRLGMVNRYVVETLSPRCQKPCGVYTRLCSYRNTVKSFNMYKLRKLDDDLRRNEGVFDIVRQSPDIKISSSDLIRAKKIINNADPPFKVPICFEYKVGAQVMCVVNIYVSKFGICNGSLGTITGVQLPYITVFFENGQSVDITLFEFYYNVGKTAKISLYQYPITLAWAISIHKCQGVTLTKALVDTKCFEYGQFYVGISRVKSLDGLYLTDNNFQCVRANNIAKKFERDHVMTILLLAARFRDCSSIGKVFIKTKIADYSVFHLIKSYIY